MGIFPLFKLHPASAIGAKLCFPLSTPRARIVTDDLAVRPLIQLHENVGIVTYWRQRLDAARHSREYYVKHEFGLDPPSASVRFTTLILFGIWKQQRIDFRRSS